MNKRTIILSTSLLVLLYLGLIIIFVFVFPKVEKLTLNQEYYQNKVKEFEQENQQLHNQNVDIVFLGDSLTDGYDVENYYSPYIVLNRGISGDTTFGLQKRLKVSAYDVQPKVVVMLIGANNFDTMLDNYEEIIVELKSNLPNTDIVLLSLTSMGKEWGRRNDTAAFNNVLIKKYAEKHQCIFIDLYYPLLNESTKKIYDEYTTDGGHFTSLGYDKITSIVKSEVDKILQN